MVSDDESPGRAGAGAKESRSSVGSGRETVEAELADALERVAHGATVSIPNMVLHRVLQLAFTAVLTNGFTASAYGTFVLARRLQQFLVNVVLGFRSGLSRFLPNADSDAERDVLVTFASLLLVGTATAFGVALFLMAPALTGLAGEGEWFLLFVRVFALGLPAVVWMFTVTEILRGFEAVVPFNVVLFVAAPTLQLLVAVVGTFVFADLVLVAVLVLVSMGLTGTVALVWLARDRGLGFRLRGPDAGELRRKYLRFTVPLFFGGIATTVQRLGFYPLIALYLSSVAAGVFAIGVLVGTLIQLPLVGINQFTQPVVAALNEEGHDEALARFYHVTSRLILTGATGLAVPVLVYPAFVISLFGRTFVEYAGLLPGFVLAHFLASAAGSVGVILTMTDHQRAYLAVNAVITALLVVTAVPLTVEFGLPGLVGTYVLMLLANNAFEIVALYYLEGLQPFTLGHARPLVAAVPFAAVALAAKAVFAEPAAPVLGTLAGLGAYAVGLRRLGFTPVERELAATLASRYEDHYRSVSETLSSTRLGR